MGESKNESLFILMTVHLSLFVRTDALGFAADLNNDTLNFYYTTITRWKTSRTASNASTTPNP